MAISFFRTSRDAVGRPPPPEPSDTRPASDPLDLIYVDQGTNETVYELAVRLSRGIRGSVVIRVAETGAAATLAIDGPAARYAANRGNQGDVS